MFENPLTTLRRARLLVRRDETLGTILHSLAAIHGDARLVEEAESDLRITYRQGAKRVGRWAAGIADRSRPGDRVVVATPNGYEQFLLCLAAARAAPWARARTTTATAASPSRRPMPTSGDPQYP